MFETSPSSLLYGFFRFYSSLFPHATTAVSVRFGTLTLQKASFQSSSKLWRLCIEDPFETCESHICHDLGCHIDEAGQRRISALLLEACGALKQLMECPSVDGDFVPEFIRLVIADEEKQSSAPKKRSKGKNGGSKAKQQDVRAKNKGVADTKAIKANKIQKNNRERTGNAQKSKNNEPTNSSSQKKSNGKYQGVDDNIVKKQAGTNEEGKRRNRKRNNRRKRTDQNDEQKKEPNATNEGR